MATECKHQWVNGREDPKGSQSYLTDCKMCGRVRRFGVAEGMDDALEALRSIARVTDRRFLETCGYNLQLKGWPKATDQAIISQVLGYLKGLSPAELFATVSVIGDEAREMVIKSKKSEKAAKAE